MEMTQQVGDSSLSVMLLGKYQHTVGSREIQKTKMYTVLLDTLYE